MREAIGSTWLFQIVIVFILLFTGYMCLSINHSKAFAVKDDIIEIIERHNGIDLTKSAKDGNKTLKEIASRLQTAGYRTNGNCSALGKKDSNSGFSEWYGFNREGNAVGNGENVTFCIRRMNVSGNIQTSTNSGLISELPETVYYQVGVFYQLDLPVLNYLMSFSLKGDTRVIYNPNEK